MREEKKIVSWSLVILFLALTIVYSLAYMKKAELFTAPKTTSLSGSFIATSSGVQVVDMQNSL
ncbi:MAG: hypothetical protein LBP53_03325 [Candidatus Peribacteria bacterium]|jgi:hypothetical protein|nr:hypothetical protein [Candidatus Peribacteria bacterium]